ncbi:MAG: class I SAM-dependent methyltransferase [Thermoleophilia bacterium]
MVDSRDQTGDQTEERMDTAHWDAIAEDFERQFSRSDYRRLMVEKITVFSNETVLDVGCGPGTLAIPLAHTAKNVTALDISAAMLRVGWTRAAEEGVTNICFMQADWNEVVPGKTVPLHDVVVCSRALPGHDLEMALSRVDESARRRVYVTVRSGPDESERFYEELHKELGLPPSRRRSTDRECLHLLRRLGIRAEVEPIIYTDSFRYSHAADAFRVLGSHVPIKTAEQEAAFMRFIQRNMDRNGRFELDIESRWAVLSWEKAGWNPGT